MSERPIAVEVGRARVLSDSNTGFVIHTVATGKIFKLESVIVTNRSGDCEVNLVDSASGLLPYNASGYGVSGDPVLRVVVGAVKTEAMGDDFIKGKYFYSSVIGFATVSGVFVHVGGHEYSLY